MRSFHWRASRRPMTNHCWMTRRGPGQDDSFIASTAPGSSSPMRPSAWSSPRSIGVDPAAIRYDHGVHGKPRLARDLRRLEFNLSHSQELALLAVTWDRPVGVDVESMRVMSGGVLELSETPFSDTEREALRALPPAERRTGFFRCWTRKEALIKATGEGLNRDLDSFDVDVGPRCESALLQIDGRIGEDTGWLLRDLPAPPGYAAAGAVEGGSHSPRSASRQSPPMGHLYWRACEAP